MELDLSEQSSPPSEKRSAKYYLKWIPDTVRLILRYEPGTSGRVNILAMVAVITASIFKGDLFSIYGVVIIIIAVYSSTLSQQANKVKETRPHAKK